MPTSERSPQGSNGMRRGGAEAPVTEEPYERIVHVRVCGGAGRATAGPTRNRAAYAAGEWEERSTALALNEGLYYKDRRKRLAVRNC